jgi:hypothetical protein
MPFNEGMLNVLSAQAGADLSKSQYYAVSFVNDASQPVPGVHLVVSTAGAACSGILQDNPINGQVGAVQTSGVTIAAISASQALTAGTTFLDVDTGGTLKAHAAGTIVAQALETLVSTTNIALISVRLLPSNATL